MWRTLQHTFINNKSYAHNKTIALRQFYFKNINVRTIRVYTRKDVKKHRSLIYFKLFLLVCTSNYKFDVYAIPLTKKIFSLKLLL